MTRRPAPTRFARAVLLSVTSAALSVTAHGLAGGRIAEFAGALPVTLLIAFAGTSLAERGRGPWSVLAALGLAQAAQHALFNLGHHAGGSGHGFDPVAMTTAHAVAVLLTGLLLVRADAALRALATTASRLLPTPPAALAPVGPPRPPAPAPVVDRLVSVLLRRVHGRRGPPRPLITRVP
ncbi:hypothetical protein [Saccharothrix xinjiangensis]|uniref:MFS transporter n=1 Tax=Saccharothrix xinjiangensis TaxID=204798 RepID=A0ABV9Y5M4_9PSEU